MKAFAVYVKRESINGDREEGYVSRDGWSDLTDVQPKLMSAVGHAKNCAAHVKRRYVGCDVEIVEFELVEKKRESYP